MIKVIDACNAGISYIKNSGIYNVRKILENSQN